MAASCDFPSVCIIDCPCYAIKHCDPFVMGYRAHCAVPLQGTLCSAITGHTVQYRYRAHCAVPLQGTLCSAVTGHTVQCQTAVRCFGVLRSRKNSSKLLELHFSHYLPYILHQNTSKLPVYSLVTLTLQSPMVTICTTTFNIQKFCILPTHCIYVFYVDLRTNSYYFPIQH